MCSSSSSGRTSDEPNNPDYIPNLAMGYGDDSLALKLSLKKRARNERRLRRSQAKDDKNRKLSREEETGAGEDKGESWKLLRSKNNTIAYWYYLSILSNYMGREGYLHLCCSLI